MRDDEHRQAKGERAQFARHNRNDEHRREPVLSWTRRRFGSGEAGHRGQQKPRDEGEEEAVGLHQRMGASRIAGRDAERIERPDRDAGEPERDAKRKKDAIRFTSWHGGAF